MFYDEWKVPSQKELIERDMNMRTKIFKKSARYKINLNKKKYDRNKKDYMYIN